jgi:hypothetical protein
MGTIKPNWTRDLLHGDSQITRLYLGFPSLLQNKPWVNKLWKQNSLYNWPVCKRKDWHQEFKEVYIHSCSVVGIATGYRLEGPGIESWWGRDFSHLSRPSLASCTGFFPEVKGDLSVTLTSHSLSMPWSWKVRAKPLLLLWAVRPVWSLSGRTRVHCTLPYLTFYIHFSYIPVWCDVHEIIWSSIGQ